MKQWSIPAQSILKDYGKIHDDSIAKIQITEDGKYQITTCVLGSMKQWRMNGSLLPVTLERDYGLIYPRGTSIFAMVSLNNVLYVTGTNIMVLPQKANQTTWNLLTGEKMFDYGVVHRGSIRYFLVS